MSFKPIRLHYRDVEWDKLEEIVKEKGFKDLSVYIKRVTHNATRTPEIEQLLSCDCTKRARVFPVNEEVFNKMLKISKNQCIPLAALVNRLFIDPLLSEVILNSNKTD